MKKDVQLKADEMNVRSKRKKIWTRIVSVLASVVVFCTTYALILPAITLESDKA